VTLLIKRLWFIDEFGVHLAMYPTYARAPREERAEVKGRFETGSNILVISVLALRGVRAPMMIEGVIDGEVLELYVEHFPVPELRPGDIDLLDNVPTHKNKRAIALIEVKGAQVEPLPAYSPELDPIEECISKVKTKLRRTKADTIRKLRNALKRAFANVTDRDARGWFKHCGYAIT
jgi:transposase